MSKHLTFNIKLCSDYHLSSGHRGIEVDSALFRDADGVPALRGTTVAALLRDGLLRLISAGALPGHKPRCKASGLEKGTDDNEPKSYCRQFDKNEEVCPVCQIFGSPRTIKPWSISSARPVALAKPESEAIKEDYWASQSAMRVRVDPRMRRAEAHKLFSQEEGDSRLEFEFTVSNVASEDEKKDAAIIVAAARMVRNLGGSRRRGRGECVFSLVKEDGQPVDTSAWLDTFKETWLEGKTSTATAAPSGKLTAQALTFNPTGSPLRLQLLVRADEPIMIARNAESGNEFAGLETIPGTAVRGAFASMAAKSLNDEIRAFFKKLFFSEQLRFSPLYPVKVDDEYYRPAFPAPLDFHTCKLHDSFDETVQLLWHFHETKDLKDCECPSCKGSKNETSHAPLRKFVYTNQKGELKELKVDRRLEMHNTIDPGTWRVEENKLFSYVPLASGQYFAGEIFCTDECIWNLLEKMSGLPDLDKAFSLKLGKASRRGYGSVTAVMVKPKIADIPQLWIGQKFNQRVKDKKTQITLTLMSDTIVPDCWGRFYTGFETKWLEDVLGTKVDKIEQQFVGAREVDSFNMKLGLPRWRDIAIVAGSSVLLKPEDDWNLARLEELECTGIGLRRNEGFGWVAFNHPVYTNRAVLANRQFKFPEKAEAELKLQRRSPKLDFSIELTFRKKWDESLRDLPFAHCDDPKFGAVARLLRAEKHTGIDDLEKRLASFGNRKKNLDKDLPESESNWFQKDGGQGKKGLAQIKEAMQKLESHFDSNSEYKKHDKRLTEIGIEMLADRIAEEANKENQGEN
jgi:CRISPR-associated protein Csx10